MQKHWYAVHTYSGHEKKVKTNVERRAETMGLKNKVFDILVPTEKESRVRQGKKSEIDRKVFPGYVFRRDGARRQHLVLWSRARPA